MDILIDVDSVYVLKGEWNRKIYLYGKMSANAKQMGLDVRTIIVLLTLVNWIFSYPCIKGCF